ncbi:hypothetical protein Cgig2_031830 [Carnegiea gigantea]|uniref:S1 motif domain-containing protein n=1 Tax=Carnegiea gigantea TaxID=171969 RepID=A0A9Q1KP24_9CARY|nr:hypothetical protein Cgig2_031830 [Carnegiea gigantea]
MDFFIVAFNLNVICTGFSICYCYLKVHDMALGDSPVKRATSVPHTAGRFMTVIAKIMVSFRSCSVIVVTLCIRRDVSLGIHSRFLFFSELQNVYPGMKLWGVIAEVNEKDLAVSRPGGLCGLVWAGEELSRLCWILPRLLSAIHFWQDVEGHILSSLFRIGQLVSCVVLQVDDDKKEAGKRKVWLSLRLSLLHKSYSWKQFNKGWRFSWTPPRLCSFFPLCWSVLSEEFGSAAAIYVLTAYVKSIEEHGYILHLGRRHCRVLDSPSETFVRTKDLKGIPLDLLVPGMMVNARVQCVSHMISRGLCYHS